MHFYLKVWFGIRNVKSISKFISLRNLSVFVLFCFFKNAPRRRKLRIHFGTRARPIHWLNKANMTPKCLKQNSLPYIIVPKEQNRLLPPRVNPSQKRIVQPTETFWRGQVNKKTLFCS